MAGSFASVLIHRLPEGKPVIFDRSECTACGVKLKLFDLIPLIHSKCRACGAKISTRYRYLEIFFAISFTLITILNLPYVFYGLLFLCVVITVIDFDHYIIPDELNIALAIIGLYYSGLELQTIYMPLLALALGFGLRLLMLKWKGTEGLGLGDVKFLGASFLFMPIEIISLYLFLAGIFGILSGLVLRSKREDSYFPFAPALCISLFIGAVTGHLFFG